MCDTDDWRWRRRLRHFFNNDAMRDRAAVRPRKVSHFLSDLPLRHLVSRLKTHHPFADIPLKEMFWLGQTQP